jgi:hypothetical protein
MRAGRGYLCDDNGNTTQQGTFDNEQDFLGAYMHAFYFVY